MKKPFLVLGLMFTFFLSCKKEKDNLPNPVPAATEFNLTLGHKVDNAPLTGNAFNYQTQAGYSYSISKLLYYISQVSLIKADSTTVTIKSYQYVDAFVAATHEMNLKDVPPGNYIGLKLNIGLDSLQNLSFGLPASNENIGMQWPDMMGGGYHFMKLEGSFKDATGTYGYAMHIGTNPCLVPITIYKPIKIVANTKNPLQLVMNINEWFRNPYTFDFNTDGNYIMGNMTSMKKMVENGKDVFTY